MSVDNTVPSIIVVREGLFGSATVDVKSGFPSGSFDGFTAGQILPSIKSLSFTGSKRNESFSVQVSYHEDWVCREVRVMESFRCSGKQVKT